MKGTCEGAPIRDPFQLAGKGPSGVGSEKGSRFTFRERTFGADTVATIHGFLVCRPITMVMGVANT